MSPIQVQLVESFQTLSPGRQQQAIADVCELLVDEPPGKPGDFRQFAGSFDAQSIAEREVAMKAVCEQIDETIG